MNKQPLNLFTENVTNLPFTVYAAGNYYTKETGLERHLFYMEVGIKILFSSCVFFFVEERCCKMDSM
jgi:hypothetical protein